MSTDSVTLNSNAIVSSGGRYLPTLDGWRAIAIVGVMICHATHAVFSPNGTSPNPIWFAITRFGALGVDIFFVLSGFLITSKLLEEWQSSGTIQLKAFYVRRCFRILPAYFTYLLVVGVLGLLGIFSISGQEWFSCAFFWRNYLPAHAAASGYTGHFWTLAVEEHFYLVWPSLLLLAGRTKAWRMAALIALVVAAWRMIDFRWQLTSWAIANDVSFYQRTDIRFDSLAVGGLFALMPRSTPLIRLVTRHGAWCFGAAACAFVGSLLMAIPAKLLLQAVMIAIMISCSVAGHPRALVRIMEWRQIRFVGRLSYSLYLWQTVFLSIGGYEDSPPLGRWQQLPLSLFGVLPALCWPATTGLKLR
ncbi:MAG: acyltransferase [Pirellulaceae bacterium]